MSLQLRICIIGHCGGHRGTGTTFKTIRNFCFWENMKSDIAVFCNSCLHCQSTIGGTRFPTAMGHALHATKPNELLHFDYLYMGDAKSGESYVLILKDDHSSFVLLHPYDTATAENAAESLLSWFSMFGVVPTWVSDQGSHFKNELIANLNRTLRAHHHFTTAYTPQSNGTVEHVCQEILRACRALLSEFRLQTNMWSTVLPLVQSILNHSFRPSLGNVAPITAFTALLPDNPLRTIIIPQVEHAKDLSFIDAQRIINVRSTIAAVEAMHSMVSTARTRKREQAIRTNSSRTNVQDVNFEVDE